MKWDLEEWIQFVPPASTSQGSKKIMTRGDGTPFVGTAANSNGESAKGTWMAVLMPRAPEEPLDGALHVDIMVVFPWRKGETKKWRETGGRPHNVRPDSDNLEKLLWDCLTACGYWTDDARVFRHSLLKFWGPVPGILVRLRRVPDDPHEFWEEFLSGPPPEAMS